MLIFFIRNWKLYYRLKFIKK